MVLSVAKENSFLLAVVLSLIIWVQPASAEQDVPLVVVVSKNNPVIELTRREVIDIYMGRYTVFPNGKTASPIDYPSNSKIKNQFYLSLVKLSAQKVNAYWSRLLFAGRARPPREITAVEELTFLLTHNTDSIAYIPLKDVTEEMRIVYRVN